MRNYAGEANWEAAKYTRLTAKLDKNLAAEFKQKLSEDGTNYTAWLREAVHAYLGHPHFRDDESEDSETP